MNSGCSIHTVDSYGLRGESGYAGSADQAGSIHQPAQPAQPPACRRDDLHDIVTRPHGFHGNGRMTMSELCQWDKDDYERKLDKLMKIVENPQFVCSKCGRAANRKKYLCKPVALPATPPA
jgi:hypothetical protein